MIAQRLIRQPAAQIAIAAWIVVHGVVLLIAGGRLPFDRPALAGIPFGLQVAAPTIGMIEVFFLMAVVYWLTRKRVIADIAARAPLRAVAGRETFALIAYSVAGQVGGWIVGPALGFRPFSFHIAGTCLAVRRPFRKAKC